MEQCTVITESLHFCSSIEWKHKNIKCTSGYDLNDAVKIKSERNYNKVLMVVELGAPVFSFIIFPVFSLGERMTLTISPNQTTFKNSLE